MSGNQTLHVVDDDPQARESVKALASSLKLQTRVYSSAEEFLLESPSEEPGCLVIDLRLPGMDGRQLQKRLDERGDVLPIIMISAFADVPLAVQAMREGAVTFIEKPCEPAELSKAVEQALELDAELRVRRSRRRHLEANMSQLTNQERKVLCMMLEGVPNKTVASQLGVSLRTIENRRSQIFRKTGCDSLAALVRQCCEAEHLGCKITKTCDGEPLCDASVARK